VTGISLSVIIRIRYWIASNVSTVQQAFPKSATLMPMSQNSSIGFATAGGATFSLSIYKQTLFAAKPYSQYLTHQQKCAVKLHLSNKFAIYTAVTCTRTLQVGTLEMISEHQI